MQTAEQALMELRQAHLDLRTRDSFFLGKTSDQNQIEPVFLQQLINFLNPCRKKQDEARFFARNCQVTKLPPWSLSTSPGHGVAPGHSCCGATRGWSAATRSIATCAGRGAWWEGESERWWMGYGMNYGMIWWRKARMIWVLLDSNEKLLWAFFCQQFNSWQDWRLQRAQRKLIDLKRRMARIRTYICLEFLACWGYTVEILSPFCSLCCFL